jgi:hypothetical protein
MKKEYKIIDGTVHIQLTQGLVTIIDVECLPLVEGFTWHAHRTSGVGSTYYASTSVTSGSKVTKLNMHKVLLDTPPGMVVLHVDGDGLNNSLSNLQLVTRGGYSTGREDSYQ